jgi:hypothetical protein
VELPTVRLLLQFTFIATNVYAASKITVTIRRERALSSGGGEEFLIDAKVSPNQRPKGKAPWGRTRLEPTTQKKNTTYLT